jgi:hypothetical protein
MGAALTYARRYALFTLVGIAGEDDLDAPDLSGRSMPAGGNGATAGAGSRRRPQPNGKCERPPILDSARSAALRDRLVHEVSGLASVEVAAEWARSALAAKNTLTASDARLVQVAFELRLSVLDREAGPGTELQSFPAGAETGSSPKLAPSSMGASEALGLAAEPVTRGAALNPQNRIDKSVLTFPEVRRYRDKAHIKFVASQPCAVCGRKPSDPHHLRFAQVRALGRKVSDEFTVPLCRLHHRELHRAPDEAGWWSKLGIDALAMALKLWKATRATNEPTAPRPTEQSSESAVPESVGTNRRTRKRLPRVAETVPFRA